MLKVSGDPILATLVLVAAVVGAFAILTVLVGFAFKIKEEAQSKGKLIEFAGVVVAIIAIAFTIITYTISSRTTNDLDGRLEQLEKRAKEKSSP